MKHSVGGEGGGGIMAKLCHEAHVARHVKIEAYVFGLCVLQYYLGPVLQKVFTYRISV